MVAVPELIALAILCFALAFCYIVAAIVRGLFAPLIAIFRPIPGVGSAISGALTYIEQSIVAALSESEHAVDAAIGASWHLMARLWDWLFHGHRTAAQLNSMEAALIRAHNARLGQLGSDVHDVTRTTGGHTSELDRLRKQVHGIDRTIRKIERELGAGIGPDVLPRLKTLEREVEQLDTTTIPAIQAGGIARPQDITNTRSWVSNNFVSSATKVFAGAVAVALGTLGLSWTRCKNNQGWGKAMCGLPSDIAQLLIDGLALFTIGEGLVVFAEHCQRIVSDVSDLAHTFWQVPAKGPGGDRAIGSPSVNG